MEIETIPNQPASTLKSVQPSGQSGDFTVEKILDKKIVNNQKLYLIKWEGFSETDSTWEPVENLLKVLDLIVDFEVRDCLMESNQDKEEESNEESGSNGNKRPAEESLSDEEEIIKKVKLDGEEDEEEDEDDEEEKEKDKMEKKVKVPKVLLIHKRNKEIEEKIIMSPTKFKIVSERVSLIKPFNIEMTETKIKDVINEEAAKNIKRKRGRPRKNEGEKEPIVKEKSDGLKKRGRPPLTLRKRGRPKKFIAATGTKKEGEEDRPKRGRGRPRKIQGDNLEASEALNEERKKELMEEEKEGEERETVGGDENITENKEENEETEGSVGKGIKLHPRKRGRSLKTIGFLDYIEKYMNYQEKKKTGKRGRPRKVQAEEGKEEEKNEAKEGETQENIDENVKETEMEVEKNEEGKSEDYDSLALNKAITEGIMKRRGVPTEGEIGEKRGRGRPKKKKDEIEIKEKEKRDADGNIIVRKRGRPKKLKNSDEKEESTKERKGNNVGKVNENEAEEEESKGEDLSRATSTEKEGKESVRKRGRPRKEYQDVNKENENKALNQNKENKVEKTRTESSENVLRSSSKDQKSSTLEEEIQVSSVPEANQINQKVGSFELKDKPKKILKVRVLTNTGSLFLVEWEIRQNDQKPDNSFISSYELKNHSPIFLAEFYESLIRENYKKIDEAQKIALQKPSEDFIPLQQKPELFGGLAFNDKPKSVTRVVSMDEKGMNLLVKWERRKNGDQPFDSIEASEALKNHDVTFLLGYYESKIRASSESEIGIMIEIPEKMSQSELSEILKSKQEISMAFENKGNERQV